MDRYLTGERDSGVFLARDGKWQREGRREWAASKLVPMAIWRNIERNAPAPLRLFLPDVVPREYVAVGHFPVVFGVVVCNTMFCRFT